MPITGFYIRVFKNRELLFKKKKICNQDTFVVYSELSNLGTFILHKFHFKTSDKCIYSLVVMNGVYHLYYAKVYMHIFLLKKNIYILCAFSL